VIGEWQSLIIDCPNPRALATFYELLLGLQRLEDSTNWVTPSAALLNQLSRSKAQPTLLRPAGRIQRRLNRCIWTSWSPTWHCPGPGARAGRQGCSKDRTSRSDTASTPTRSVIRSVSSRPRASSKPFAVDPRDGGGRAT